MQTQTVVKNVKNKYSPKIEAYYANIFTLQYFRLFTWVKKGCFEKSFLNLFFIFGKCILREIYVFLIFIHDKCVSKCNGRNSNDNNLLTCYVLH